MASLETRSNRGEPWDATALKGTRGPGGGDLRWVVLLALAFVFSLAFSWQRWGSPVVDCGREMNQPLRLANGEVLYSEVRHIYGPLSPYLNAALFRLFKPSLGVLYADGIVTAVLALALVYWLSRQLMGPSSSAVATLSVMGLCAFKPAGNYILPYAYSAVHGCALGLATLVFLVRFVQTSRNHFLILAGLLAGLTMLAKTEMGLAALIGGAVAALLEPYPSLRRTGASLARFFLPALLLSGGVYAYFGARVGWHILLQESHVFFQNVPPEFMYFNRRKFGFDRPLLWFFIMIVTTIRLAALAAFIAGVSLLVARRKARHSMPPLAQAKNRPLSEWHIFLLLVLFPLLFLVISTLRQFLGDLGPYLAIPILLVGLLALEAVIGLRELRERGRIERKTALLMLTGAYALTSIARMALRVPSGGAYASYLMPACVILFIYGWLELFPLLVRDLDAQRLARQFSFALFFSASVATLGVLAYRYRVEYTSPITTFRGTMFTLPAVADGFNEAIGFINRQTAPGDPIAVFPEGTSLIFFTGRRNPLLDETSVPGCIDAAGELRAIQRLKQSHTRFVFILNRKTEEFGPSVFGRDYYRQLGHWIEENFELFAVFGPDHNPNLQIGDKTFFVRAYRIKSATEKAQTEGKSGARGFAPADPELPG